MEPPKPLTTVIYPQQVERALETNLIELVMATRNIAMWSPIAHPEKVAYWQRRQARLRKKREILLRMQARGQGAPYVREGPPEIP